MASLAHHTAVARKMALLFLKGVRMGSPMRALATTLPEKMTSIEESHSDSGCFREKASPAEKIVLLLDNSVVHIIILHRCLIMRFLKSQ